MSDRKQKLTRREFLRKSTRRIGSATALAALSAYATQEVSVKGPAMPKRVLGKTGLEVSVLSFGGGSQFLKNEDGVWEPMLERAIKLGINCFDTSAGYQWDASMSSEERLGQILPRYRDSIVLCTKFDKRDVNVCMKQIETSLKRLKTDYLDILLLHSVEKDEDIGAFEKGMYREMRKLKDQGVARHIGFSSMNSAAKSKELMEKLEVDVAILALNPTRYGDFAELALPIAREKNIGVIAMKVMRNLVGKQASAQELLGYGLSQAGVASAVVGHVGSATMEENVRLAVELAEKQPLAMANASLETRLAHLAGPQTLCWARPGYFDGMKC